MCSYFLVQAVLWQNTQQNFEDISAIFDTSIDVVCQFYVLWSRVSGNSSASKQVSLYLKGPNNNLDRSLKRL